MTGPDSPAMVSTAPAAAHCASAVRRVVAFLLPSESELTGDVQANFTYLFILLGFILLPFAIRFDPAAAPVPSVLGHALPGICFSHEYLGVDCPGCGMTRAFILIVDGRWGESLHYHRLGIALYAFLVYQALYRLYCLARRPQAIPRTLLVLQRFGPAMLIILLIANWLFNLAAGCAAS